MAGKVKSFSDIVHKKDLEAALERERGATQALLTKALEDFYMYLLEAGHLRPTPEADAEVRRRLDAREISLPKPQLITP
jgi:hypothetical protein